MSTRREFAIGVVALLVGARAGAQTRTFRVAYLSGGSDMPHMRRAWQARLAELGYREGVNLVVDFRYAGGDLERLPALAAELVALQPDVFCTSGTPATLAAQKATRTIPIVFAVVSDPVGQKIVNSLARPGTNATGLATQTPEFQSKRLQLLKEILPGATRVAVLHNPLDAFERLILQGLNEASGKLGVSLRVIEARSEQDLATAFNTLERERSDALWIMESNFFFPRRARIVEFANRIKLPGAYGIAEYVEAGGLMSYSYSLTDMVLAGTTYVSKILKGAKPDELPVEQPTKFELVINLKTAKALGLTIPQSILLRADRVIE